MALTMSASAIHAQAHRPIRARCSTRSVGRCAKSSTMTEMFISAFYAVDRSDRRRAALREHRPSARVRLVADGKGFERLAGERSAARHGRARAGHGDAGRGIAASDLLVLFTDGVSDARNRDGERLGEEPVLRLVRAHRDGADPRRSSTRVIELLDAHTATAPRAATISRSSFVTQLSARPTMPRESRRARLSAGPQEPRAAFSHRPAHPRAHRRRARARTASETVIEIGPGRGSLTDALAAARRPPRSRSSTIARSPRMLRERYARHAVGLGRRSGRARGVARRARGRAVRLVGNVPVLHHDADSLSRARAAAGRRAPCYLVQREVAERIVARAGIQGRTARCR